VSSIRIFARIAVKRHCRICGIDLVSFLRCGILTATSAETGKAMVVSGVATAAFIDGRVTEMKPGDLFYVPPEPHDSWVVGDKPCVSLHFLGASKYAK
jgi:gentisate 1,2-dioxygenase